MGKNYKYNGGNNENTEVVEFVKRAEASGETCMLVCPEIEVLSVPRIPVEIINGMAVNKEGADVTDKFLLGTEKEWQKIETKANGAKIKMAILKANSPSCGCEVIYDGTFTGKLVPGDGFFTKLLKEKGIKVITEKEANLISRLMID
jgi:uncharacterized protein YbbK (DUF523 family)